MTKTLNIFCLTFTVLFACTVFVVLSAKVDCSAVHPGLCTIVTAIVPVLGFLFTRRRSLLSFAFSFLPALPLLPFFLSGVPAWLYISAVLFTVLVAVYNIRPSYLPQPRFSTQKWLTALILSEVILTVLIFLFRA